MESYGNTVTANESPVTGSTNTNVSAAITGLIAYTTYHFRVKAISTAGTTYGSDMTFTTSTSATIPSLNTASVTNITISSATSGGNITSDGGATVTARGVCWSTSQNPTVDDSYTTDGSGTGTFSRSPCTMPSAVSPFIWATGSRTTLWARTETAGPLTSSGTT